MTGFRHICPICGKEFWGGSDWQFIKPEKVTRRKIYYCSWKCVRTLEEMEAKRDEHD